MAEINLGNIKFNWKGAYAGGTAYVVDDVVESGGSSYVCILASTGNTPPNGTYWNLMAQGGTGSAATLTTQGDILYRDGSGLQRLGAGTNGQLLKTGGSGANPSWTDAPSGVLKKVHDYSNSSRTTISTSANTNVFNWTTAFVPLDPVNNKMKVTGIVPVKGSGQNFAGYGLRFQTGSTVVDFQGVGTQYVLTASQQSIMGYTFIIDAGAISANTHTIYHRNYSADSQPSAYFPNSSDDSRLNQTTGFLIIEEFKN